MRLLPFLPSAVIILHFWVQDTDRVLGLGRVIICDDFTRSRLWFIFWFGRLLCRFAALLPNRPG
jgi:hypothetical protein